MRGETYRVITAAHACSSDENPDIRPTPSTHRTRRRSAPRFEKRCTTTRPLWPNTAYTWHSVYADVWDGEAVYRLPDAPAAHEADLQEHAPHIVFTRT